MKPIPYVENILSSVFLLIFKMCLFKTYTRNWVGKYLSDMLPFKKDQRQEDVLPPLLFNFALENIIRMFYAQRDG